MRSRPAFPASHWPNVRLRNVLKPHLSSERRHLLQTATQVSFLPMEAIGERGELDLSTVRAKTAVETGYTLFFDGDVLIAKITPCFENGKGAVAKGLLDGIGFGTTELYVLTPKPSIDAQFLYYVTVSHEFRQSGEAHMTGAAGQKRVPEEFVLNFHIGLPPLLEQRAIADFLDLETAKIDELISEKKRLLELLTEKRQALITHAVTRGLNPDVPMRASGVEWLGEIPEHWEAPPVYARYDVALGKMLDEKRISGAYLSSYLRNTDVQWHRINIDNLPKMDFDDDDKKTYALKKGDILICEGGEIGRTAIWQEQLPECYYQKALHRLRPITSLDNPEFFAFVMEAVANLGVFAAEGNQSTIQHLTAEKLRVFRFPSPPFREQKEIVAHIQSKASIINDLSRITKLTIDLLHERRAALISAAVTGQLQITTETCNSSVSPSPTSVSSSRQLSLFDQV